MKKRILFLIALLCLFINLQPICVTASGFDPSQKCTLTLTYTKENVVFPDLEIKLYRIANVTADFTFEKAAPYDSYPVEVSNVTSQTEWNEIATTFSGYVKADGIQPYVTKKTDADGEAYFGNIEAGLYLVSGVAAESDGYTYNFRDFMICLPDVQDGAYNYNVDAKPKSEKSEPVQQEKEYTVIKLWKDEKNETSRPESITVDILKNGEFLETAELNKDNGWTYTFKCSDSNTTFYVVERNVPEGYTVKVTEKETSFIITNTWEEDPTDTPPTGDTVPLHLYMIAFCISGLALVVIGAGLRRKEDAVEK